MKHRDFRANRFLASFTLVADGGEVDKQQKERVEEAAAAASHLSPYHILVGFFPFSAHVSGVSHHVEGAGLAVIDGGNASGLSMTHEQLLNIYWRMQSAVALPPVRAEENL